MFTHSITVRGFHCDLFGHVNNARYLEFLEETRWEWLNRKLDFAYFVRNNKSIVVVSITIHYRRPSQLNDVLNISVDLKQRSNKSAVLKQDVVRQSDGVMVAEAEVTFAIVDNASGRAVPFDDEIAEIFAA